MMYIQLVMLLIIVALAVYITITAKTIRKIVDETCDNTQCMYNQVSTYSSDIMKILRDINNVNINITDDKRILTDIKCLLECDDFKCITKQFDDIKNHLNILTADHTNVYHNFNDVNAGVKLLMDRIIKTNSNITITNNMIGNVQNIVEIIANNNNQLLKSLTALEAISAKKISSTRKKSTLKFKANPELPKDN